MTRYRAAAAATLRIVPLDALTLVYHRASGITHVVDSPVPELLEALGGDALTLDETLAALAAAHDLIDPDAGALAARLDELVAAGLVEQV
ncbi:HPr-rel-A system PqqD family peptide chaperone [Sphingomonas sp. BT-65]|uniref:HPr-rel-A system PqqD family peptide chaperone n=1 Tax=Sphingomonas sp. BT-65 TaxID=2989821 RepID=UPI002235D100|nr:HPr-rel-A system PqqD family peptide chaperone [Sphingomonas sp. BT-65]MCW4463635.1 HPr-rel-A system PqqD family peptide chaperone [Sphingomonas sp. BT-65]